MKTIKAIEFQTITDITVQTTGGINALFEMALTNARSITQLPEPGDELTATATIEDADIVGYFSAQGLSIATAMDAPALNNPPVNYLHLQNRVPLPVNEVVAIEGQSLLDLAIQTTGSIEGVFAFGLKNSLPVSQEPQVGSKLKKGEVTIAEVAAYFSERGLSIATAMDASALNNPPVNYLHLQNRVPLPVNEVVAIEGQSLLDLAIQTTGSIEGVFAFGLKNGISPAQPPNIGLRFKTPAHININVVNFYASRGIKPASAVNNYCKYAECDYVELKYWV